MTNLIDVEIGQRLALLLRTVGISQGNLAESIGVSYELLGRYVNGDARIGALNLVRICEVTGAPINWFFCELGKTSKKRLQLN